MDNEKEIYFARRILDLIRFGKVSDIKLCYPEEKDVVVKALSKYISDLESDAYYIGRR